MVTLAGQVKLGTVNAASLFHRVDVDHLHTALLHHCAGDRDVVAQLPDQQCLGGLMVLQARGDIQISCRVENAMALPAFAQAVAQGFFAAPRSPPSK